MVVMSNLIEDDIYKTGAKFCDTTFKLSENVRTQRRVYTKFVTILGDVGGLMEVLFTLFRIISSFSVDILYEISMVNGLFKFDLDKKSVILRDIKLDIIKPIFNPKTKEKGKDKEKVINEEIEKNNIEEKQKNLDEGIIVVRKNANRRTVKTTAYKRTDSRNNLANFNFTSSKSKPYYPEVEIVNKNLRKDSKQNPIENRNIVKKVHLNRACIYFLFCFVRRGKNKDNILINEGMNIISSRLDIFNIFEKMYKEEQKNEPLLNKIFSMSDECKIGLKLAELNTDYSGSYKSSSN